MGATTFLHGGNLTAPDRFFGPCEIGKLACAERRLAFGSAMKKSAAQLFEGLDGRGARPD